MICPKCNNDTLCEFVLLSNPLQYEYSCKTCDFELNWRDREDPYSQLTEEEKML